MKIYPVAWPFQLIHPVDKLCYGKFENTACLHELILALGASPGHWSQILGLIYSNKLFFFFWLWFFKYMLNSSFQNLIAEGRGVCVNEVVIATG